MLGIFLAVLSIICLYGRDFSDFNSLRPDILEPEKSNIQAPVSVKQILQENQNINNTYLRKHVIGTTFTKIPNNITKEFNPRNMTKPLLRKQEKKNDTLVQPVQSTKPLNKIDNLVYNNPLAIIPIKKQEPPPDKPLQVNLNPPITPMEAIKVTIPQPAVISNPWSCHHWNNEDKSHTSWPNEGLVCSGVRSGKELLYKSANALCGECSCCERVKT